MATDKVLQDYIMGDTPQFMMQGRLEEMAGKAAANFQEGMIAAQKAQISVRMALINVLLQNVQAILNQGLFQYLGSALLGSMQIIGGGLAVGGGVIGGIGAAGEGSELSGLIGPKGDAELNGVVEVEGPEQFLNDQEFRDAGFHGEIVDNAPEPREPEQLSDVDKGIRKELIAKNYAAHTLASQLGQAVSGIVQGAGQLGNAPLQAGAAKEQANAKAAEAYQSTLNQLVSSAETAAQNAKAGLDQALSLYAQIAQSSILLAAAH